jgi:chorismate-pyruvate lyase
MADKEWIVIVRTAEHITADLMYPLNQFYLDGEKTLPAFERLQGEALPEPARSLLVHDSNMTTKLESFVGSRLRLKRLEAIDDEESVTRRTVLFDDRGRVVKYVAIRIEVLRFPLRAQKMIRQGRLPLGAVMNEHHVDYRSRVRGYFKVQADAMIREALGLGDEAALFGRRNVISNYADQPLADAVEILSPL